MGHRELTASEAEALGYRPARVLETGECAGVMNMIFTFALFVGLDEFCSSRRFCYETRAEAEEALRTWDGRGDPPGLWLKEKGIRNRNGPGALKKTGESE